MGKLLYLSLQKIEKQLVKKGEKREVDVKELYLADW